MSEVRLDGPRLRRAQVLGRGGGGVGVAEDDAVDAEKLRAPGNDQFVGLSGLEVIHGDPLVGSPPGSRLPAPPDEFCPFSHFQALVAPPKYLVLLCSIASERIVTVAVSRVGTCVVVALDADVAVVRHVGASVVGLLRTVEMKVIEPGLVDLELEFQGRCRRPVS
jgi:hypothetical protein